MHLRKPDRLIYPREIACRYQLEICSAAKWQLVEDWGSGFRAEVLLGKWVPSAQLRIEFETSAVAITEVWQATALPPAITTASASADFILGEAPDGDGGFGFSASGYAPRHPTIFCNFEGPKVTKTISAATELERKWEASVQPSPKAPRAKSMECGEFDLEWCGCAAAVIAVCILALHD